MFKYLIKEKHAIRTEKNKPVRSKPRHSLTHFSVQENLDMDIGSFVIFSG